MRLQSISNLAIGTALMVLSGCSSSKKPAGGTGDNSQTSVDWPGTYYGITPCADCEGIETRLTLMKDKKYSLERKYLGKSEKSSNSQGDFSWDKSGSTIRLAGEDPGRYKVGENKLWMLDQSGAVITGALASKYELNKLNMEIADRYWKLVEINGKPVAGGDTQRKEAFLQLRSADMRYSANGGCNNLMGSFSLSPMNRIKFGQGAATMMACPDMTLEKELTEVLEKVDNYSLNGDQLSLNKARMAPLARFVEVKK